VSIIQVNYRPSRRCRYRVEEMPRCSGEYVVIERATNAVVVGDFDSYEAGWNWVVALDG
jgi:hypothetical protein